MSLLFFVHLLQLFFYIYNVESDCQCKEWTGWYDGDDPSGSGDYEKRFYNPDICDGNLPDSIKCVTVDDEIDYYNYNFPSGIEKYCNVGDGFIAVSNQILDFKVKLNIVVI